MSSSVNMENTGAGVAESKPVSAPELPAAATVAGAAVPQREGILSGLYRAVARWVAVIKDGLERAAKHFLAGVLGVIKSVYGWLRALAAFLGQVITTFCTKVVELLRDLASAVVARAQALVAQESVTTSSNPAPRS